MTISVKMVADSISPSGHRISTMQLTYPRFIHSEFMTHRTFCLDGDSTLEFDLPSGTKKSERRVYEMSLRDFVKKWHSGVLEHKAPRFVEVDLEVLEDSKVYTAREISKLIGHRSPSNLRSSCRKGLCIVQNPGKSNSEDFLILGSDYKLFRSGMGKRSFSIVSRLQAMRIRQLNENTGEIQNSTVVGCCVSGVKEVFEVTAGNYKVAGSKDHRILTASGWKRIEDIVIGEDYLLAEKFGLPEEEKADADRLRKIGGEWRSRWQREIKHTLAREQQGSCANCGEAGALEVHHIVPVHKDQDKAFDRDNVEALCQNCHKQKHSTQGWQVSQRLHCTEVLVESVKSLGEKETFDLEIAGQFANFLANGVVVHNSRNASSSRAIPVSRMLSNVWNDPAMPVHWGTNKPGMQAGEELPPIKRLTAMSLWRIGGRLMCVVAWCMSKLGLHKQVANRLLEPWQHIHVVVTATEWDNFFALRCHPDAQPEFQELARLMRRVMSMSLPRKLKYGEWHLPYVTLAERAEYSISEAIRVSAARCCRVSYMNHDGKKTTLDQDLGLYNKLVTADPPHMSPVEHQATASPEDKFYFNLRGWQSNRWWIEAAATL